MLLGALSYFAALGMSEIVRRGGSGWWVPCGIVCYMISLCYFYEAGYDWYYNIPSVATPDDPPLLPPEPW